VRSVGSGAFALCGGLTSVTIPASVTNIGAYVFSDCRNLQSVCFVGDRPEVGDVICDDSVTTYVREGTSGWGTVPGTWQGRPIKLWTTDEPSPIPDVGGNAELALIMLKESKDERLVENFMSVCKLEGDAGGVALYDAYRIWAGMVTNSSGETVGLLSVRNSSTAWTSFALDSATLLRRNPSDEDLDIEDFQPSAIFGKFDFTVSIKDVTVGSDAAAENLKKVFWLEGGTTFNKDGLSSDNVDITFGTPVDGKVKFTAGPNAKNADAKTFFMKVKMNP